MLYPPGTRKNNRYYVLRETHPVTGRQIEISTHATNARDAEKFARGVRAQWARETVEGRDMTFAACADVYAEARSVSKSTQAFLGKLKTSKLGQKKITRIRAVDVHQAAAEVYADRKNETKNRCAIVPAAAVLHYAAEQEWCAYVKISKLPEADPEPRRAREEDMVRLIAASSGDMRRFLTVIYYQGFRLSEALWLTRRSFDFERGTIGLYVGKARRWKTVPMSAEVASLFVDGVWYGPTQRAFAWPSRFALQKAMRKLTTKVGVRFTAHMARHAYGSEMNEYGASAIDLTKLSTWTNPKSTQRYIDPGNEYLRGIIEKRGRKDQIAGR